MTESHHSFTVPGNQTGTTTMFSQIVHPHNQFISTKLDDLNYLIWKQQVITTIRGYGLEFFTRDAAALQSFTIDQETQQEVMNPDYIAWLRQDQLLALWILSSLIEEILILIVGMNNSKEI